jgi:TPR repeat protein
MLTPEQVESLRAIPKRHPHAVPHVRGDYTDAEPTNAILVPDTPSQLLEISIPQSNTAEELFQRGLKEEQNGNYVVAVWWYRRAAERDYAPAQCNLGVMYANGRGVEPDDTEAVRWFRRAAEQDYARAQCNLGVLYENGRGVKQDDTEAAWWYRRAAEQDYARAQCNLGVLYAEGHGVKRDMNKAIMWFRRAAMQGYKMAKDNFRRMEQRSRSKGESLSSESIEENATS